MRPPTITAVLATAAAVAGTLVVHVPGSTAAASTPQVLTVTGREFAYSGVPAKLKGGLTTITFVNAGKRPHSFELALITGTHSDAEIKKIIQAEGGAIPSWIDGAGGIGAVKPGKRASVTLNLRKGNYVAFSSESDDDAKVNDLDSGMSARFAVVTDSKDREPTAPLAIRMSEYGFEVPKLKPGVNRVAIENTGKQLHHVLMVPLMPGKTVADVKTFVSQPPAGPPPIDFERAISTAVQSPGVAAVVDLELAAGRWAILCFLTDRAGGEPHVMKGMIKEVLIS